jgi:hypothetical protein
MLDINKKTSSRLRIKQMESILFSKPPFRDIREVRKRGKDSSSTLSLVIHRVGFFKNLQKKHLSRVKLKKSSILNGS